MAMSYIKLTSLNDFTLEEGPISPTGKFKESIDSFYVTDSPLSVTNIAEMAMLSIKLTSLRSRKWQLVKLVSLNKILTVSMFHIML